MLQKTVSGFNLVVFPPGRLLLEIKANGGVAGESGDVAPLEGDFERADNGLAAVFGTKSPVRECIWKIFKLIIVHHYSSSYSQEILSKDIESEIKLPGKG